MNLSELRALVSLAPPRGPLARCAQVSDLRRLARRRAPRAVFDYVEGGADEGLKTRVEALLKTRFEARQAKDWAVADKIRDELNALNVVVMDGPDGATWRLAEKAAS